MEIHLHNVMGFFYEYNKKYFGGILPLPNFGLIHSYRTVGFFSCDFDDDGNMINQKIEMSDNYDYLDNQFKDILLHEMIHYYLAYVGLDVQGLHGEQFLNMANEFNRKYHTNITPMVDINEYRIKRGKSYLLYKISSLF